MEQYRFWRDEQTFHGTLMAPVSWIALAVGLTVTFMQMRRGKDPA